MRVIDADVLKENYKNKIKSNLIDTRRGIDFLRYTDIVCKDFNKFIDEQPTIDVFNKIRTEIINKSNEFSYRYENEDWSVGLEMALKIIDKYRNEVSK